jgi:hypothetical protein
MVRSLVENRRLRETVAKLRRGPAEFVKVAAGSGLQLDGWVMKPANFDSTRRYPVFFEVYGEPAAQTVLDRWSGPGYLWNLMLTQHGAPFNFFHPTRPIYTRPRFLPATQIHKSEIDQALVSEGCYIDNNCQITNSVVGIRTAIQSNARISRSVLLGADYYEENFGDTPMGIGKNAVLDRVIVDKNARIGDDVSLVNERNIQHADGDGYYIRSGIIIVPKNGVVKPGTVV